jgi:YspA, cpYpsA-related SLOG family
VIWGGAPGVDMLGYRWAKEHNVPATLFSADWTLGRSGGVRRNVEMAKHAEGLIAIWNGRSPGTRHMIEEARRRGLKIYVHVVP